MPKIMKNYYNTTTFEIREIPEELVSQWIEKNNPKASEWSELPEQPSFDPSTEICEWVNGSWVVSALPETTSDLPGVL